MTHVTKKAMEKAEARTEARAAEIVGHAIDRNDVTDVLWMIATAVGFAREHAEAQHFGPNDVTTLSYRQLASQLQRGL